MNNATAMPNSAQRCDPSWIWIGDGADDRNAYLLFRREFPAASGVTQLRISAAMRYRVYLNGAFLNEGPPPSLPQLMYYDTHDLSACLKPGRNCLAIVVHQPHNPKTYQGALWAALVGPEGKALDVTDGTWRCCRAPQWDSKMYFTRINAFDPCQESYDARKVPPGWVEAGFDDASWPTAVVTTGGGLKPPVPRDIPPLKVWTQRAARVERIEECTWLKNRTRPNDLSICLSQVGRPLQFARVDGAEALVSGQGTAVVQCSTQHLKDPAFDGVREPCLVLDFGRVVTGCLELDLEGQAGAYVDIGVAERLIDGHFNNCIEGEFASRYTLKAGRQGWRTFSWRAFRFVKLRFHECYEPLTLHGVTGVLSTFPMEEKGQFQSSDTSLNQVFDICRYTIRLCCHESIMDTPWREQAQWLGDISCVTAGGMQACFGDTVMLAKFMRQCTAAVRPDGFIQKVTNLRDAPGNRIIPDYGYWWIMRVWQYYLYTGERHWLEDTFPLITQIIDISRKYTDADGLLSKLPFWVYIDWANVDVGGQCAPFNGIFVGALEAAARIATELGKSDRAAELTSAAKVIRSRFMERFYDSKRRVFADANHNGTLSGRVSEHTNAVAIHFGLCDGRTAAEIVKRLYEDRTVPYTEATPFFSTVILRALDDAGRMDLALQVIRDRWGRRMVGNGATSTYEEWGENGSWRSGAYEGFMRTHSHAWSSGPAEFLIRNLAGIRILEPGCRRVEVAPQSVGIDYDVTYPTPSGVIRVRRQDGKVTVESDPRITVVRA